MLSQWISVNRLKLLFSSLLLGMFVFSSHAPARMYKWVDEKGTVHYSNSPPPRNATILESSHEKPSAPPPPDPMESEMLRKMEQTNPYQAIQARRALKRQRQRREAPVAEVPVTVPPQQKAVTETPATSTPEGVPAPPQSSVITIHEIRVLDTAENFFVQ